MIKYFINGMFFGAVIGSFIYLTVFSLDYKKEIKESRLREDLLLQEVKLLDYQINVLTNKILGEK